MLQQQRESKQRLIARRTAASMVVVIRLKLSFILDVGRRMRDALCSFPVLSSRGLSLRELCAVASGRALAVLDVTINNIRTVRNVHLNGHEHAAVTFIQTAL